LLFCLTTCRHLRSTLFPYTTLFRSTIQEGDVVFCYNFRTDRGREITIALTQQHFPKYDMHPLSLYYVTMTSYDDTFKNVHVVFRSEEHTSELQSRENLVCRLLLEKK